MLKNVKVRQAMNYAIDRKLLVDAIFDGRTGVPKSLQMSDFGNLYISDFINVTYDPDKAKALLKEAGYKGEEISYRYLKDYYTGEISTAQILVEMWRQVGLNVNLELKENRDQIKTDGVRESRAIVNWSNTAVFPDPFSQLYRTYGPDGFFQRHNMWTNSEFNKWGGQLKDMDPAKRSEAAENRLRICEYDDPPGTYLYYLSQFYGKSKSIKWQDLGVSAMSFGVGIQPPRTIRSPISPERLAACGRRAPFQPPRKRSCAAWWSAQIRPRYTPTPIHSFSKCRTTYAPRGPAGFRLPAPAGRDQMPS